MQSFKAHLLEEDAIADAKKRLKKMKKGSSVSFTNQQTGKKVTGTYRGMKSMGGRSYAHVEHPKGVREPNMVPVHHIHS